jgi:hypothetical protein
MGKPDKSHVLSSRSEYIGPWKLTRGTETSKYPEEKKITYDSLSSGERTGKSPNHVITIMWGCRADNMDLER